MLPLEKYCEHSFVFSNLFFDFESSFHVFYDEAKHKVLSYFRFWAKLMQVMFFRSDSKQPLHPKSIADDDYTVLLARNITV